MRNKYKKVLTKYLIPVIFTLAFSGFTTITFSQIDTEFWFAVPELSHRGNTGGTPGTLRIATLDLDATVTISMPANPLGFPDIVVNIPGNQSAAVDLSHLIDVAASPAITGLENKPLTADGINDFGLLITSTNMITCYWEINYNAGSDLWTLKGNNALGTEFYTPFQTTSQNFPLFPQAYSAIDVVATQTPTQITFDLPPGIAASYGSPTQNIPAGGTHTVTLGRGQTFSLFPLNMSPLTVDRLAGTRITSDAPIAVSLKDDATWVNPNGQDVVGDQIVPVDIAGDHYIIPWVGSPTLVYVVATVDNTSFDVFEDANPVPTTYGPLNAGQQQAFLVPNGTKFARIITDDPAKSIYVFQVGSDNKGRGGALVPAIGCTGNTQLAFTRARANKFNFFIIVEQGNQDKFLIDGVPQLGAGDIIDPGAFTLIPGSGNYMAWFSNSIPASKLSVGQHLVQNTGGIFHLGIQNGFTGNPQRIYYGYYSDFGGLNIGANVAGTNSSIVRACYGDPVQLYAFGGTEYTWTPDFYLDDATSNAPTAINLPPGAHDYTVSVGGACNTGSVDLTVLVASPVVGHFVTDVSSGCAPLDISINDQSTGVYEWQYDLGDGSPPVRYDLNPATPYPPPPNYPQPFSINYNYTNTDTVPIYDTITLLVKNESGCSDILKKTIIIFPQIQSSFSLAGNNDDGCDPHLVQFQNTSVGDTSTWLWEFGDGGSTTERDPSHLFRNQFGPDNLVFTTRLITTSPDYCRDTFSQTITVRPYIEANFAFDTSVACSPHEIIITDQSIGADTYFWDFGDGTNSASSGPLISKNYINDTPDPVTYTVKLRVDNEESCFHEIERDVTIYPGITASFQAIPDELCSPSEVLFQNNSSGAASYFWDFGDGGTATDAEPVHLYDKSLLDHDTTNRVTLIATSTELCTDTADFDILIHPYIEAAFTVEDIIGCHPFTIIVNNQSVGVDQYSWDFGDGSPVSNTSAASFNHTYSNTGGSAIVYTLRLIVLNSQGCSDTLVRNITVHPEMTADFISDVSEGCHPLTVDFTDVSLNAAVYSWDFGDGASSVLPSPDHTFFNWGSSDTTFTVTLTTSSSDGECVKMVSAPIVVNANVETEFTFAKALDCNPFEVTFENLSVGGSNFTWDFDDGTIISVSNTDPITHTFINNDFTSVRDFEVVLQTENYAGCTGEARKTVSVYPDIQAGFSVSVTEGCHPLNVEFTNQSDGAQTYIWDFGDGATLNAQDPIHTFLNTGTIDSIYTVTLISVAPNNVCRDTFSIDITVYPNIEADFTFQGNLQCTPSTVQLNNASVGGDSFQWDFGDGSGTTTTDLNPVTHVFTNSSFVSNAVYQVVLTAENTAGCTGQITKSIEVYPDIEASFTRSITNGCHPLEVEFTNSSNGAYIHSWDFGDGSSSDVVSPVHTFSNFTNGPLTRQVKLTATSQFNCTSEITASITIQPKPTARFETDLIIDCPPFDVTLVNSSINADQYSWTFGDGDILNTSSSGPISHTYENLSPNTADYTLTLIAGSSFGCVDSITQIISVYPRAIADFSSITEGCSPLTAEFTNESTGGFTYLWEFGDGSGSVDVDPAHTYFNYSLADIPYSVNLTATTEFGCVDSKSDTILVYPQPETEFIATPSHQSYPSSTVSLDNVTNPGPWSYAWDMGDDFTSAEEDPLPHTYATWGDYTIRLDVSSDHCVDSVTHDIRIFAPSPIAGFEPVEPACEPHTVQFTNNSQYGHSYLWEFDDGTTSTQFEPSHTFTENGIYNVKLTLTGDGGYDYAYNLVEVYRVPVIEFNAEPDLVMLPDQVAKVYNFTKYGTQYLWDFGDNTTSTEKELEHYYTEPGIYDVSLTVWNDEGCEAYLLKPREIEVIAEPLFIFPNAFAPNPNGSPGGTYDPRNPNNEVFSPVQENVYEYHLLIYNRWGELVFETKRVDEGWDGYCGSKRCTEGVYIWKADVTYLTGLKKVYYGDVTLLHKKE